MIDQIPSSLFTISGTEQRKWSLFYVHAQRDCAILAERFLFLYQNSCYDILSLEFLRSFSRFLLYLSLLVELRSGIRCTYSTINIILFVISIIYNIIYYNIILMIHLDRIGYIMERREEDWRYSSYLIR